MPHLKVTWHRCIKNCVIAQFQSMNNNPMSMSTSRNMTMYCRMQLHVFVLIHILEGMFINEMVNSGVETDKVLKFLNLT